MRRVRKFWLEGKGIALVWHFMNRQCWSIQMQKCWYPGKCHYIFVLYTRLFVYIYIIFRHRPVFCLWPCSCCKLIAFLGVYSYKSSYLESTAFIQGKHKARRFMWRTILQLFEGEKNRKCIQMKEGSTWNTIITR